MIVIGQGLTTIGEGVPPMFDPLGEGADEKEVADFENSLASNVAAGKKKPAGGGGKVRNVQYCTNE